MRSTETIGQDQVRLSNRRPARAQAVPVQGNYPPHDHEFYEICLVTAGRALHRTAEGDEWLRRGSVVIVAPGQTHAFARTEDFGVVNVYYLAEWFLSELQGLRAVSGLVDLFFARALFPANRPDRVAQFELNEPTLRACLRDLGDLQAEWESERAEPLFCEAALLKCMIRLARAAEGSHEGGDGLRWSRPVARSAGLIESAVRAGAAWDLSALAKGAGVSPPHLCRLFKAETGLSPGAYFQRLRIQRACRALLTSQTTTAEIAHALGYADSPHFNRSFKAITGTTPREYRRRFAVGQSV